MYHIYVRLLRLYGEGRAKDYHLANAVKKGLLTAQERQDIIKSKEEQDKKDSEVLAQTSTEK